MAPGLFGILADLNHSEIPQPHHRHHTKRLNSPRNMNGFPFTGSKVGEFFRSLSHLPQSPWTATDPVLRMFSRRLLPPDGLGSHPDSDCLASGGTGPTCGRFPSHIRHKTALPDLR